MTDFVEKNERLRDLNEDYDVTSKLQEEAGKLPSKLGGAAGTLRDVGFGIVNSIFALVTILILTAFMLGSGGSWVAAGLRFLPEERAGGSSACSPARRRPCATTWPARWRRPRSPACSPTSCCRSSACRSRRRSR